MIRAAITLPLALALGCTIEMYEPPANIPWQPTAGVGSSEGGSSGSSDDGAGDPSSGGSSSDGSSGEVDDPQGSSSEDTAPAESSSDGSPGDDGGLDPPAGASSGGAGGGAANGDLRSTASGVDYRILAPGGAGPHPLMIVYSGTEGVDAMTSNLQQVAGFTGTGAFVFAVIDGWTYNGDGAAGGDVLDDVRAQYDIDNDRTYLLSESAGTTAGLELGLMLRPSWFAAYWANDVNASAAPSASADELGFAPWGNAGPGGDFADADAIVGAMQDAGYRTEAPAPYDGAGAGSHGAIEQFLAALEWFPGKQRL